MANISPKGPSALNQPSGPAIGSRQGGAPSAADPRDVLSQGQVHKTRVEKKRGVKQSPRQVDAEEDKVADLPRR